MDDQPRPGPALAAYLKGGNPEGRKISQRELAELLEVRQCSISQYVLGVAVPTPARRLFIEAWSGGAIPATWWQVRRDRKEGIIRAKLRRMFPDYKPARGGTAKTKAGQVPAKAPAKARKAA